MAKVTGKSLPDQQGSPISRQEAIAAGHGAEKANKSARSFELGVKMRFSWLIALLLSSLSFMLFFSGFVQAGRGGAGRFQPYEAVRHMGPSGYWPADEGAGAVLHDRSGHGLDGKVFLVGWQGTLLDFTGGYHWLELPARALSGRKAFSFGGWLYSSGKDFRRYGLLFMGEGSPRMLSRGRNVRGVGLRIRSGRTVEVISHDKDDLLGSRQAGIAIADRQWVHVFFSYAEGIGTLYLNGKAVREQKGLMLHPRHVPLFIGCDASWWQVHPPGTRSLRGSVRHLITFDRALSATEVARLVNLTRPYLIPPPAVPARQEGISGKNLSELLYVAQNEQALRADRAQAVLAMAKMRQKAVKASPVLQHMLQELVEREGVHVPRVENILRNALIKALMDIDYGNVKVQELLGKVFAVPLLQTIDLSEASLKKVKDLMAEGKSMKALLLYRTLARKSPPRHYFSFGDVYRDKRQSVDDLSYTAMAERDGVVYRLGKGKGYQGVEPVPASEFAQIVQRLSVDFPAATHWRKAGAKHISRVVLTQTDRQGNVKSTMIGGPDFIFDGTDAKIRGWSIAIDQKGYIHIMGGQHNRPDVHNYIPGSWEKIGLSHNKKSPNYPDQMYWVSKKPGDISAFEFVGQRKNPRHLPTDYFNYMNFVQDRKGTLFVFGRVNVSGFQSWGLFRYDAEKRRWHMIGGKAGSVLAEAQKTVPGWEHYLIRQVRGSIPYKSEERALAWAWQPNFYNYCRSLFGIRFDRENRMHLLLPLRGLDGRGVVVDQDLYVWSDDEGRSFHRADGSPVNLPLTVNPAPTHNPNMSPHSSNMRWWKLWRWLLSFGRYQA